MSPSIRLALRMIAVFAILFVVAEVLLPIFAKQRECAYCGASCASNEKQVGLALEQYAQDNDEMMPNYADRRGETWRTALLTYVKTSAVFACPEQGWDAHESNDDHEANPVGTDGVWQCYAASYIPGNGAFAAPGSTSISIHDVEDPKHLITLMEAAYNPFPQYDIDDAQSDSPASRRFWAGHKGGSNYLFFDGHVQYLHPMDTYEETNGKVLKNLWYRDGTKPLSANGVAVLQDAQKRFGG